MHSASILILRKIEETKRNDLLILAWEGAACWKSNSMKIINFYRVLSNLIHQFYMGKLIVNFYMLCHHSTEKRLTR